MFRKITISALFILTAIAVSSCYEEGGARGGNINEPEYRIVKPWQITHTYLNGEEITETDYYANRPSTFYYIYADCVLSVTAYFNGQVRESTAGHWIFKDHNKILEMEFSLLGYHYFYQATVKKLTKNDLIYEYDDPDGNHWRIEMGSRASY
ncbi:MAG: hypothetical protein IKQ20_14525 [Bacteroidales bacterium]|nr:hypothetical protein [Bacteroidales bacterium]MCR5550449.1 hypothetical protein [Bacteroidales bacterium]